MERKSGWAHSRVLLWGRIAATILAWAFLVVLVHRLAHTYQPDIVDVLKSPALRIAGTAVLLTGLVYLMVLSLPLVPNLGLRGIGMVLLWATLLVTGHSLSHMGFHEAQALLSAMREAFGPVALLLLALAYAITLAVPFIPGVELGLLIMAVFGPAGALVAYAATLGGLSLAYAAGQLLPERIIIELLARIGIPKPRAGVALALQSTIVESRLGRTAPKKVAALLLDHRHLTLAVGLNFPGNSALGGGGGLALLCGLSKQFRWRSFLLTAAIATSPVPILVLAGLLDLEPLMKHHGYVHDVLTWIERLFIHN